MQLTHAWCCAGREFECDNGYMGVDGMCVRYTPRGEREAIPSDVPCGMGGQAVCAGDSLNGVCAYSVM